MIVHEPIDDMQQAELQDPYAKLKVAVESLPKGKILPIECADVAERKRLWDVMRYWDGDLILLQRGPWLFISKGNWQS